MAFSIKNKEADRLARELARETGESLTEAVVNALRERLKRVTGRRSVPGIREDVERIQARVAKLPIRDQRTDEEILGYDKDGLPS